MKNPFHVYVDQSAVGIGKTYNALAHALLFPSRYLFVTERKESVLEVEQRARAMASDRNTAVAIKTIFSDTANRGASVATEVAALPLDYANENTHVIVIITHSAMMASGLSGFQGWHIIIDEVPNILVQQSVRSKTDVGFFETNYTLEQVNGDWSKVGLTDAGRCLTSKDLADCESHGHLRAFHQRVSSGLRPVLCDIHDWEAMTLQDVSWTWWSMFDIRQLEAFETVKFLGSGFMSKLAAKMLQNHDSDVAWIDTSNGHDRKPKAKTVNVHYFTDHSATRYYFETDHGQRHLGQIARHLNKVMPTESIWSANDPVNRPVTAARAMRPHMGKLRYLSPKQAGTSEFMGYHDAAILYASKPSSASKAILSAFGCTEADWIETNEFETILQFLTRTSVRDQTVGGTTNLYVLSRDQADYLVRFFEDQSHITVTLNHIEIGLEYPERQKRGPKVAILSPAEAMEKEAALRATKAEQARVRRARAKGEA
jgi:hypothetical protein